MAFAPQLGVFGRWLPPLPPLNVVTKLLSSQIGAPMRQAHGTKEELNEAAYDSGPVGRMGNCKHNICWSEGGPAPSNVFKRTVL